MRPEERDLAYLFDMRSAAAEVIEILGDRHEQQFLADRTVRRAVERCVEVIGEAARRVSPSFQQRHHDIPWRDIIGQRNVLAHEYGAIDHALLYRTVRDDVPALLARLDDVLGSAE